MPSRDLQLEDAQRGRIPWPSAAAEPPTETIGWRTAEKNTAAKCNQVTNRDIQVAKSGTEHSGHL